MGRPRTEGDLWPEWGAAFTQEDVAGSVFGVLGSLGGWQGSVLKQSCVSQHDDFHFLGSKVLTRLPELEYQLPSAGHFLCASHRACTFSFNPQSIDEETEAEQGQAHVQGSHNQCE